VQGVFGGSASLLEQATSALGNVAPYHYADYITNRMLYAGADVGNVTQATGYSFTRASDGYYTNSDGTLTNFASGALRRGDRGVLIEGSRTNLLLRSQEFDNATWTKTNSTVTANATTAPDGTTTAEKVIADNTNNLHQVDQSVTLAASTTYTFSAHVKKGDYDFAAVITGASGGAVLSQRDAVINLTTGALVSETVAGMTRITALANGWYRVAVTTAQTSGIGSPGFRIAPLSTSSYTSYTGDNTSGIFIWGAQLEAASFPSSYIPTVAASATRAADVLTYTAGVSYPLSLWAEFERVGDTGGNERVLSLDSGANTDRAEVAVSSADLARYDVVASSASQMSTTIAGALALNTTYKTALRVQTNDSRGALGGTLSTQDTSVTLPASPSVIRVGHLISPTDFVFGHIRRVAVVSSAVSDANLQVMTT
jgi:hypothetical protein